MSINLHLKTKQKVPKQTQNRFGQWAKLIAITGSAQVIVQAVGFISGILVIRLLPTHEYALYTLANTMLGTMTLLADGGISTGVMSQGGKVWQDQQKLGAVLVTGMQLRKKFALYSLLVATPILLYLLHKHDASWLMSGLIVLSLIPAFFTSLSGTLLEIAPKLQQDIAPLQKIQILANIGRLALLGLTLFIYPFAAVAITAAGGSQLWSNWRLRKISTRYADRTQPADPENRAAILNIVKRVMPSNIYYCLSGQMTIWIISIVGNTDAIAQVGALSRLGILLNIISSFFATVILPRFVRLPNHRKLLATRFLQLQAGLIICSIAIVGLAWYFPNQLLWVLGENYYGLTSEVFLMAAGACASLVSGSTHQLLSGRGIILPPQLFISSAIVSQVIILVLIKPNNVYSILLYGFISSVAIYLIRIYT